MRHIIKILTKTLMILISTAAITYPFIYFGMYAGDAEIHLVYGEHAASGALFEFNIGEKSSGVTSPGYMLILATMFNLLPASMVPVAVKIINLIAWYSIAILTYLIVRRMLDSKMWAYFGAITVALLPGSAYNSTIGMENGIFAAVILLFIYLLVRWNRLCTDSKHVIYRDLSLGTLLGISAWLRPEGILVGCIAFTYMMLLLKKDGFTISEIVSSLIIPVASFTVLIAVLIYLHAWITGDIVPSSGVSRMIAARENAISVGPFFFTTKLFERLMYYAPLSCLWLIGNYLITSGGFKSRTRVEPLMILLFWSFFILYSTVLGTLHLARYTIFIMPLLVTISTLAGQWLWMQLSNLDGNKFRFFKIVLFLSGTIMTISVFVVETSIRTELGSHDALRQVIRAPSNRTEFSNLMMSRLANPKDLPVSLAYQEVQIRYRLDDRFIIRSLDGRVDKALISHIHDGNYDHLGYIRDRQIDFVIDTVNYNRNKDLWSLSKLTQLEIGAYLERDGIIIKRIGANEYKVVSIKD